MRPPTLISSSSPLSQRRSGPAPLTMRAEVSERKWSCESVTERDELVGRIKPVSRLPQLHRGHKSVLGTRSSDALGRVWDGEVWRQGGLTT